LKNQIASLVVLLFSLVGVAQAAVPTLEGLLRNPSNKEVLTDTVELIYRIKDESIIQYGSMESETSQAPLYQKIYWRLQEGRPERIYVVTSKSLNFDSSSMISVKDLDDKNSQKKAEQALLLSTLNILNLNYPKTMLDSIKNFAPEIKFNRDLVNYEKASYYQKYKDYVIAKKKAGKGQSIPVPDQMDQGTFSKMMGERYYNQQERLKLVRAGDEFVWQFENEKISFEFGNQNYKMKKMQFSNMEELITFQFGDYVLFDGQHELPKYMVIKRGDFKKYKIDFLEYKNRNYKPNDFAKLINKFRESMAKPDEKKPENLTLPIL